MNQFKLLKENSELAILDSVDDPAWSRLADLDLDGIFEAFISNKEKYQKVRIDCFIDGKLTELKVEDEMAIQKLNCPFRISNLQFFIPEVRLICSKFFSSFDTLLNCHLYYRPAEEHPAPYYHSDSQHMLVYQFRGESKWMFPMEQNSFIRDTTLLQMKNLKLDEGIIECPESEMVLTQGRFMFVPYALSHNIVNPLPTPSVYLTFGEEEVVLNDVVEFIGEQVLGMGRLGDRYFDEINIDEFRNSSQGMQVADLEKRIRDMFFKAKMEKFKGGGRL